MNAIPPELQAALADRYELEDELGHGGMATVYAARDSRHHRLVAVKVMAPEFSASAGSARFLREIEIAANLTHPHILPVHDSGEAGGFLYYVMPIVDGGTLRDRVTREGRLGLEDALRITREVADGLDHAHRHGVVHRDVKPGNILLADGHAFIADFGIARTLEATSTTELTRTGLALGTPTYMSPEQAGGETDIDARSDVYALGCVLYELLAGSPPLVGATPQATLARRLTEMPGPIRKLRPEVPPGVEKALVRALAPRREDRYASAGEFADALTYASGLARRFASLMRRTRHGARSRLANRPVLASLTGALGLTAVLAAAWAAARIAGLGPGGATREAVSDAAALDSAVTTVAVLYLDDISPDGSLIAYATGFTRSLIGRLNSVEGLAAPSLQAVRRFRATDASPDSIARALAADFLVEGAVLPTSDGMRVEIDVVDPDRGVSLAQMRQEGTRAALADLADAVADSLSLALRPVIGRQVRLRELRAGTASSNALDLVWRAEALREEAEQLVLLEEPDRAGADAQLATADSLLAEAERLDPDWIEPPVARGWVAHQRALYSLPGPAGEYDSDDLRLVDAALAHAEAALRILPDDPQALDLRGTVRYGLARRETSKARQDSLLAGAEEDLTRAVTRDARLVAAWVSLGGLLQRYRDDLRGAQDALARAYEADRFLHGAAQITEQLIALSTDLEDYDEAWRWAQEGRLRWPDVVNFNTWALTVLASRHEPGDPQRAWAYWDTIQQTQPRDRAEQYRAIGLALVGTVLARARLGDSARAVLRRGLEGRSTADSAEAAYNLAYAYLVLGDTVRCLDWLALDLAVNPGSRAYRSTEPWFRPLRGNPRFEELVRPGDPDEPAD